MAAFVVNTIGILTFHCSKIKRLVDLRNLITNLITSLFKLLELLVESTATFSLVFNFEKDESNL